MNTPEIFTADTTDWRELVVQVWYPAEPLPETPPTAYSEHARTTGPIFADFVGLPRFLFDHLSLVKTHSYRDAPIAKAEQKYPVLIFSHGYGLGTVTQNTVQMEELASHGYIVFSISHPYEALTTIYPDGRIVPLQASRVKAVFGEEKDSLYEKFVGTQNVAEKDTLFRRLKKKYALRDESLHIWTAETRFVTDELEKIDSGSRRSLLTGKLDLERIGVLGMSFGGATAGQTCLESIYGQRMLKIINAYTLSFFDKYLKNKEEHLLDGSSRDYPEAQLERRNL